MSSRPQLQTQFVIFILFGDVITPRTERVWTGSLLKMLDVLGISERAVRSTVSRMRRKGWLKAERDGRRSLYTLTARGRRIVDEGGQRIFEARKADWNGEWFQVVYSLPENKRRLRNDLRKRLSWLGFGRLAPGTWISPHNRLEEVQAMVADLGAGPFVNCFAGLRLAGGDNRKIVEQCWDIRSLHQQYLAFIRRWEPEYEKRCRVTLRGGELPAAECFAQRFWITQEYSPFPRLDPNLPSELLPGDWSGDRAATMFADYRRLLGKRSDEFIENTLCKPGDQP